MYLECTGSSFTLAPKQSCWKSKANFHFTARQLPDTEQMNAAANKSIKSYIKTTVLSLCVTWGQRHSRREKWVREQRKKKQRYWKKKRGEWWTVLKWYDWTCWLQKTFHPRGWLQTPSEQERAICCFSKCVPFLRWGLIFTERAKKQKEIIYGHQTS